MSVTDPDRLILIRHAMPETDPRIPGARWHLGDEGRAAARELRPLLAQPAYYVASPEPKALETLQEITGDRDVPTDPGFAEVRRPSRWSDNDDYRAAASAYAAGVRHEGWESHEEVVNRFDAAMARHAAYAAARDSTLIIGTHGLALTTWLASRYPLALGPAQFWASLRFPDIVDVDRRASASRSPMLVRPQDRQQVQQARRGVQHEADSGGRPPDEDRFCRYC